MCATCTPVSEKASEKKSKNKKDVNRHREQIQSWLKGTLKINNWTPNEWATKAKVSPTTITEFLNNSLPV